MVAYEDLEKLLANDNKVKVGGETVGNCMQRRVKSDFPFSLFLFFTLLQVSTLMECFEESTCPRRSFFLPPSQGVRLVLLL
jgi:hypothetical protein